MVEVRPLVHILGNVKPQVDKWENYETEKYY